MSHFSKNGRIVIAWVCAALVFALAWWWRAAAQEESLSSFARHAIRVSATPMQQAREEQVSVYATNEVTAATILDEAVFSIGEISRRLGVEPPSRPVRILLISDSDLIRREGFRPDSLAVNWGDEIFLKDDVGQGARPDRVAHELVHFVLRETYGAKIPLWFDEGLAARLGLAVSRIYRAKHGWRVTGSRPGLSVEKMDSLAILTGRRSLPKDPEAAQVFYRAAEELVALIEDSIASAQMPTYISEVATGADWYAALNARVSGSPLIHANLEETLRKRVATQREF